MPEHPVNDPIASDTTKGCCWCLEIVVRVDYGALNFRDFVAASGMFAPVPAGHVPGNEGAGTVLCSQDPQFQAGDRVFVSGHGLGENRPGTMAGEISLPAAAACHLPGSMTTLQAATVGVAGLVACAARQVFAAAPEASLPVAVTGAMGGTGRVALACFARSGLAVTALTRNPAAAAVLSDLGACAIEAVPGAEDLAADTLGPERFAAAFDVTGGMANWLTRHLRRDGTLALVGFSAGHRLQLNALALILRRLRLLGVNAALSPPDRAQALQSLSQTLLPEDYGRIAHLVSPQEIPQILRHFGQAVGRGRVVVALP